jgi:hypothetical protein
MNNHILAAAVIAMALAIVSFIASQSVYVYAVEWWEAIPDNRTAEQKAQDAKDLPKIRADMSRILSELDCLNNLKTEYVHAGDCGTPTVEQQLAQAREATIRAQQQQQQQNQNTP